MLQHLADSPEWVTFRDTLSRLRKAIPIGTASFDYEDRRLRQVDDMSIFPN